MGQAGGYGAGDARACSLLSKLGKRHAALALARYAPVTSPLRRYTDLVNEAQVLHFYYRGLAAFEKKRWKKFWPRLILF